MLFLLLSNPDDCYGHTQELAPDLKRKVDERRKESAEWDKLYGNTTGLCSETRSSDKTTDADSLICLLLLYLSRVVETQYQKAVEREGSKKV
ncbi:hypothetical protein PtA15_5A184 [Puccinia triticina]|uniref:Uncharacterized protein n=1 Tax=Puccinia triticina TaxID=208348 RepID=A0ABY7CKF0_9BASI|nr:uncharacterized protein PtA15_5A184 [Puccinia triticina]WAQ84611.1 hypothetical protein PtA15_5A184 [Puccinia triticina]WAR57959.1 hypothetical protein PtB15_5B189 [Puccinia triticina]